MPGQASPVSWKLRLKAWWEGYDLAAAQRKRPPPAEPARSADMGLATEQVLPPVQVRPADRIKVLERIWGEGFATPGGSNYIPDLVRPFGLTPAMSVLDLGAGLGGSSRTMVAEYGAWVTGLEADRALAEAGQERSIVHGMEKQAAISAYDPETFELHHRYDCVFAKEAFFTVQAKDRLFDVITRALKPRGQIAFTDYILGPNASPTPGIKEWQASEPVTPNLWTLDETIRKMRELGYEIRTTEDVTATHRQQILKSWGGLSGALRALKEDRPALVALMEEAELWTRRVKAFDDGLKVYRFYAYKGLDIG